MPAPQEISAGAGVTELEWCPNLDRPRRSTVGADGVLTLRDVSQAVMWDMNRAEVPTATTRLDCERSKGYTGSAGAVDIEYCPLCGHPTDDGRHEVTITVRD